MTQTVLILGPTGKLGGHAVQAFRAAGWTTILHDRKTDDLMAQARGADVILNGWNPPGYGSWADLLPGMTARVIAAARVNDATVIIPGNVYVFGAGSPALLGADTPHRARNPLGRLRIEMEQAYRAAGVRTVILRAGDFIDTGTGGAWFDAVIVKALARGKITYPGRFDIEHAFAYTPDLARAMVGLAAIRSQLPRYADIPFAGYTLTGRTVTEALQHVTGRQLRLRRLNWPLIRLLAAVWPTGRGLVEMRYLWDMPHRLDPAPLRQLLPGFAPTPLHRALSRALSLQVDPDQAVADAEALA